MTRSSASIDAPICTIRVASVEQMRRLAPADPQRWLSESEWLRSLQLRAPQRLEHFLAGRWLLRLQLARIDPERHDWNIIERRSLPPRIADRPDWYLSLSHSGPWVACAIASTPIGIDLEQRRARPALAGFAHLLCHPDESPEGLDLDALLERWVVKETYIKRDCGSALPERLAELQLSESDAPAEVCLWKGPQFLFATTARTRPQTDGPDVLQINHWRVVDTASGTASSSSA